MDKDGSNFVLNPSERITTINLNSATTTLKRDTLIQFLTRHVNDQISSLQWNAIVLCSVYNQILCLQFVCMGGTPKRMEQFAYTIMAEIGHKLPCGTTLQDISQFSYRYSMYKVGPVLCISVSMTAFS